MNEIAEVEQMAVATAPTRSESPVNIMMTALGRGLSIDQMQGMFALQKEWEANEARKAYVAAIAEFKKDPPEIFKRKFVGYDNRDGTTTGYHHATLGDVTQAISSGLALHGISHRWDTKQEHGRVIVTCTLTHRLGHSESTTLEAAPDGSGKKNGIQQVASTVTYLQRYTLLAASGIATKDVEDDDGAASGAPVTQEEQPEQPPAEPTKVQPKFYPQDQFEANVPRWEEVAEMGRMTPEQIVKKAEKKFPLTEDQKARVMAFKQKVEA